MDVKDKIKLFPHSPGVYRYYDSEGNVIYVGKAKDLHKRVAQYFVPAERLTRKTAVMVSKIADAEYTVVESESDALLLENNLIKQYKPRYNILLKDSKTYPWICVSSGNFPKVFLTRKMVRDGSRYFGPYSSVVHARNLVEFFHCIYPLRTCKYLRYVKEHDDVVRLVAVVEPDRERLSAIRELYQLPEAVCFTEVSALFTSDIQVDACIIGTPDKQHYDLALKAMDKGWDILLEKPMSQTAPEGSASRCLECSIEKQCRYSAVDLYLRRRDWVSGFVPAEGETKDDAIMRALKESRFGRCVYACPTNDVIDRQVVEIEMESGIRAEIIMECPTEEDNRITHIDFENAVIEGDKTSIKVVYKDGRESETYDYSWTRGLEYHAGADLNIVEDFVAHVLEGERGVRTSAQEAVVSHVVCFMADESRLAGGKTLTY